MRTASITDLAKSYVEQLIFNGEYEPGVQIKEEQVAALLNISRPPIREAFKLLEAEGLVVRKPRRGVFVAEIQERDAWEVYTLKAELYDLSIDLSFDRLTMKEIGRMGSLVAAMEECLSTNPQGVRSYQELNTGFHDLHVGAAGHERLKRMLDTLHNQVRFYSYLTLSRPDHLSRSFQYHRRIYEAFRDGDKILVKKLIRDHVMAGLKQVPKNDRAASA